MRRPLFLAIALAVAVTGAAACKKSEEPSAPAAGQAAPAAPDEAAKPDAAAPGAEQMPAQPGPAPDKPET